MTTRLMRRWTAEGLFKLAVGLELFSRALESFSGRCRWASHHCFDGETKIRNWFRGVRP